MKTKFLLFCSCFFSFSSFAQDSVFHLKDYKYRTRGFRALEFTSSFNGNINDYKQQGFESHKDKSFQLTPSWISYSRIFSSDKKLHAASVSLNPSLYSISNSSGQGKSKYRNGQAAVQWQIEDRFYKKDNWFLHLKNSFYTKGDFTKQHTQQNEIKTNMKGIDEDLSLGFGKGRIEIVDDAQMALFIINDLKAQGLIDGIPDAETVNEFARLITELNNQRVFDSRRKRVYQLTQIDKFLREKAIVSVTDIRHFTTINDNWLFAFSPARSSGSNWYIHVISSAEVGKMDQTNESTTSKTINENNYRLLGIGPRAGYENFKPINLNWQQNLGAYISWQVQKNKEKMKSGTNGSISEYKTDSKNEHSELGVFYGIGFYPTNRTRFNTTIDMKLGHTKIRDLTPVDRRISVLPSIIFSTDYFISYKTRLHAGFTLLYRYQEYKYLNMPSSHDRSVQANLSAGISHFFL